MVRDDRLPRCESCCNDGPDGDDIGVEIQRDRAGRAALLECALFKSIGDEAEERANLIAGLSLTRQRAFKRDRDTLRIERQPLGRDLLFAFRKVVIDRAFGSTAASDELIDSCPGKAGLLHEEDRGFQNSVLPAGSWRSVDFRWHA